MVGVGRHVTKDGGSGETNGKKRKVDTIHND